MNEVIQNGSGIYHGPCVECNKMIYIPCKENWYYKIKYGKRDMEYFCGYTCHNKAKLKLEIRNKQNGIKNRRSIK